MLAQNILSTSPNSINKHTQQILNESKTDNESIFTSSSKLREKKKHDTNINGNEKKMPFTNKN